MNPFNVNCPFCSLHLTDIGMCSVYNRPVATMPAPNDCEMFTCTAREYRKRVWKIIKLAVIITGFITLLFISIRYS